MSETLHDENMTATRYCGPEADAVIWYGDQSRVRFEIWRDREKLADLNIREAAAIVSLLLDLEPKWQERHP